MIDFSNDFTDGSVFSLPTEGPVIQDEILTNNGMLLAGIIIAAIVTLLILFAIKKYRFNTNVGGKIMRIVAIVLNFLMLGALAYTLSEVGFPRRKETSDWLLLIIWLALPICNLIALIKIEIPTNLLMLYIKRKTLEEKKKIENLKETP